jgi:predicted short-subunit dehydrogenase-like oxidoreductase (DUF2520 family)
MSIEQETILKIGIVGLGAVGSSLARALHRAGHQLIALVDSKPHLTQKIATDLGIRDYIFDLGKLSGELDCLIIAVPDDQIPKVDRDFARIAGYQTRIAICVHTSGALSGAILENLSAQKFAVGSIHPLQTFSRAEKNTSLEKIYFAIEAPEKQLELLESLVRSLKGIPLQITGEAKVYYHAAAVFASNFMPVIVRSVLAAVQEAGISPSEGRNIFASLMQKSLDNCLKFGELKALTGPVARGDVNTIKLHLDALVKVDWNLANLYRRLSLEALSLTAENGLEEEVVRTLYQLLTAIPAD